MSWKKKPFFKVDPETGRCVPLPLGIECSSAQKPSTTTFNWKPQGEPLTQFSSSRRKDASQPEKYRKTEKGVRKELFKMPDFESPKQKRKSANENGQKRKKASASRQNIPEIKITPTEEEAEPKLKTPTSLESITDFLKLEEMCKDSPLSSVCSLLKNRMVINSTSDKTNLISKVKEVIMKDKDDFEEGLIKINKCISDMATTRRDNFDRLMNILGQFEDADCLNDIDDENKENSSEKRRSLRLLNKNSSNERNTKPSGSPVILKAGDLRKSTLTKSLVSKCQKYQLNTPRHKALELYNSTRQACSILVTPKTQKGIVAETSCSEWRSNLSIKVHEQCLLLQDTPLHK